MDALRARSGGTEFVFPAARFVFPAARSGSGSFGGMPRALARIIGNPDLEPEDRATLSGVGLHHLRHALATTGNALGMTLPTVAALLGHTAGGVAAGYIGRVDAVLLAAADRVAVRIAEAMGWPEAEAELIEFPSAIAHR